MALAYSPGSIALNCSDQFKNDGLNAASEILIVQVESVTKAHSVIAALPAFNLVKFKTLKVIKLESYVNRSNSKVHKVGAVFNGSVKLPELGGFALSDEQVLVLALTLPDLESNEVSIDACDGSFILNNAVDAERELLLRNVDFKG